MTRTPEERLAALERSDLTMREDMAEVKKDVREMRDAFLTARGGWKALALMFAFGSFVGGLATKLPALFSIFSPR